MLVSELFEKYGADLELQLIQGEKCIHRKIHTLEVERPGLSLSGYLKNYSGKRLLVFGTAEIGYLQELDPSLRMLRLKDILLKDTPAVMITHHRRPLKEMLVLCEKAGIPVFRFSMKTMELISRLTGILGEEASPQLSCHGTLVEAFGMGVLIQGESAIGKSEAALGLIEKGHRFVADDHVQIRKKGDILEGSGPELTRHLLEIRGIGILNVAHLFGVVCIREFTYVDMIIELEKWNAEHFYDRIGFEEKKEVMLGVSVPFYLLPVKPGRDIVRLIETTVLNHRLKEMGYHSAKEFKLKLLEKIAQKQKGDDVETHLHSKS